MCRLNNNTTNKSKQRKTREKTKRVENKKRELNFFNTHKHSKPKQAPPFWTDSVWFHPLTNTYIHHKNKKKSSIYLSHSFELTFSRARARKRQRAQTIPLITVEIHFISEKKNKQEIPILSHVTQQVLSKTKSKQTQLLWS